MFFRRTRRGDPWLPLKIILFSVGAILALAGMVLDSDLIILAAGLTLAAGLLLRFVPRGGEVEEE